MNMVGELVLVRNRPVSLGLKFSNDEEMSKAVSNLDVVTADLQGGNEDSGDAADQEKYLVASSSCPRPCT